MRSLAILSAVLFLAVVMSCGGGGDDGSERPRDGEGSGSSAPSGNSGNSGGDGGGGGENGDFCAPDSTDEIFDGLNFAAATSASLEDQAGAVREALARWSDRAPGEIRADVEVLVTAVSGFYELLEEHGFDIFALGQAAADDPRMLALDSANFESAVARIESYCGFDLDRPSGVGAPPDAGGGGSGDGGTVMLDGELPEGFPEELVPPESEVDTASRIGPALTATFRSTATLDEIREFYSDTLGDPNVINSENFVWNSFSGGQVTSVTVSGVNGAIFIGVSVTGG